MQAVIGNTLIQYIDEGKRNGVVLLCVHGWMHDHTGFTQLAKELSTDYRVISVDLPNFGASQSTDDIVSLDQYAQFLAAFANKLDLTDYILVGHSMGGQISIYGVGQGIVKPRKLILIASAGVRNPRKAMRKGLSLLSKPGKYLVPSKYKAKFYQAIGSDYSPKLSPVHKQVIAQVLQHDIQADASKITIPTLLIYGAEDRHTTAAMGQALHTRIKGSRYDIIPGENHWVHQLAATAVAGRIREFLK